MKILRFVTRIFTKKNKIHPIHIHANDLEINRNQCVICYENVVSKPVTCCKQPICAVCIKKTREQSSKCPCCRRELSIEMQRFYKKNEITVKIIAIFVWIGIGIAIALII
jgi:hypothetical protein